MLETEEAACFLQMVEMVGVALGSCQRKMMRVKEADHQLTRKAVVEDVDRLKTMMVALHLKKGVLEDDRKTVIKEGMEQDQTVKTQMKAVFSVHP